MIVTEYCPAGDLRSKLVPRFLWINFGKQIMLDVLAALVYLHDRRIIHFDITSRNVLLSSGRSAKITGELSLWFSKSFRNIFHEDVEYQSDQRALVNSLPMSLPSLLLFSSMQLRRCTQSLAVCAYNLNRLSFLARLSLPSDSCMIQKFSDVCPSSSTVLGVVSPLLLQSPCKGRQFNQHTAIDLKSILLVWLSFSGLRYLHRQWIFGLGQRLGN